MWNEIVGDKDLNVFLEAVAFFHDSCIKEIKYTSGAYVDERLAMYPINDQRILSIIIHRQFEELSMFEMQFEDLKYLKLFPVDERYTCEILGATMFFKDGCFYWRDCDGLIEDDFGKHEGTMICASKFRWRAIDGDMGKKDIYVATL